MVSLIKNQLLKHLSRFTKNLAADQINLSTFKGEGELSNLELNEIVLTDLLELPSWLRLTNAWCNRVSFRIQWTKLKSVPIFLTLDEVQIKVETCAELRSLSMQHGLSSYTGPAKYSFINKVVDGITVAVNVVKITFNSPAFIASVEISRILVESKSPQWQRTDLRMTRIKDPDRGQLLIFKELEWQTVRIEARSTCDDSLTPLRLLTNQARCRIIMKKRTSDSMLLGSKLVVILDDLLWVLTDSQLKAALHFVDSLSGLVQRATELTRVRKAAQKLEILPEYQAQISQETRNKEPSSSLSRIFNCYDVVETSYHFLAQRIDLHLCDDPGMGRSVHVDLKDGAAFQITLQQFQVDYYPYHLAIGNRKHWPWYKEGATPHSQWLNQSLTAFRNSFIELVDQGRTPQHTPVGRTSAQQAPLLHQSSQSQFASSQDSGTETPRKNPPTNSLKSYVLSQLAKLMTSCIILRIQDFSLYQVTTTKRKHIPLELISGDRDRITLPEDITTFHAEFIYYYYPGDKPFPLPPPKFYLQVLPVQVNFDVLSFLWLNAFTLNLYQSLGKQQQTSSLSYIDVKIEAILPRVLFHSLKEHPNQRDRPRSFHIQVSRVLVTNIRNFEQSSRADLAKCIDAFQLGSLFYGADFPAETGDEHVVTEKFLQHISGLDSVRSAPTFSNSIATELDKGLPKELLWTDAKDVWNISLDPIWGDFVGAPATGSRPIPFLDAFPLVIWTHVSNANIKALAHVGNLVSIQLNHYQYLFLLRLAEQANELASILSLDASRILKQETHNLLVLGVLIPQVEVTFIMPSHSPGKECSAGDFESVIQDSASIQEEPPTTARTIASNISSPSPELPNDFLPPVCQVIDNTVITLNTSFPSLPINNLNVGLTSVKKGFTNFITSVQDVAFKPSPDDASDTTSVKSDGSSDNDKFIIVDFEEKISECQDAIFKIIPGLLDPPPVMEKALEVVEDETLTSPSDQSVESSSRRKDLVSMSTFKLGQVELVQQSQGFDSVLKVQVGSICTEECGAIPWDEFQNKFGCRSRAWIEVPNDGTGRAKIGIRFTHKVKPGDLDNIQSWNQNNLTVQVCNLDLNLCMSTISGLTDLVEDEIIPTVIPMQVSLENVKLHLKEDRPPVNITSPGPIPVHLEISKLLINRGLDGIFHIEPQFNGSFAEEEKDAVELFKQLSVLERTNKQLHAENIELKCRLSALERVSEENHVLRQSTADNQVLRSCLLTAQDEVAKLLQEKKLMLEALRTLQEQQEQLVRTKR